MPFILQKDAVDKAIFFFYTKCMLSFCSMLKGHNDKPCYYLKLVKFLEIPRRNTGYGLQKSNLSLAIEFSV